MNFVTFWLSCWQNHESWFVHILQEATINKLFPLQITPKPNEIKRIYLLFGSGEGSSNIC